MRKWFMRQYWRIQQSQALISLVFWTSTLTLLIWPYVSWRFKAGDTIAAIPVTYFGLISIAVSVLVIVLLVGLVYDVTLGLWRDHITVMNERNPFATYKLNPTWGLAIAQTNEILRRVGSDDEDIQRHCRFIDRMLEWNSQEEIWARSLSSWREILGDEDPFLFHLSEDAMRNLEEAADNLEEF
ncbi:MAG: hypothetical protein QF911_01160 [Candidatus Thalassarchaeaceae archaeon]|nr:hypothetical protein [Candidatus Thalassarchaeaceae archaeon]